MTLKATLLQRLKSQMAAQLEEVKRMADEETRERQSLNASSKNLQHEVSFRLFYLF